MIKIVNSFLLQIITFNERFLRQLCFFYFYNYKFKSQLNIFLLTVLLVFACDFGHFQDKNETRFGLTKVDLVFGATILYVLVTIIIYLNHANAWIFYGNSFPLYQ